MKFKTPHLLFLTLLLLVVLISLPQTASAIAETGCKAEAGTDTDYAYCRINTGEWLDLDGYVGICGEPRRVANRGTIDIFIPMRLCGDYDNWRSHNPGEPDIGLIMPEDYPCPVGQYWDETDLICKATPVSEYSAVDSDVKAICPEGHYCPGGTDKISCPAGTYGATTGLSSESCSGLCEAGYYCPEGSTSATQVGCPEDYTSDPGAGSEEECFLVICGNVPNGEQDPGKCDEPCMWCQNGDCVSATAYYNDAVALGCTTAASAGCQYCDNGVCKMYTSGLNGCATCKACNSVGSCVNQTTTWGANLYGCTNNNKRCYGGSCVTCGGLIAADGLGGTGCWYLGVQEDGCNTTCGAAGCVAANWNDDTNCSVCKALSSGQYDGCGSSTSAITPRIDHYGGKNHYRDGSTNRQDCNSDTGGYTEMSLCCVCQY